MAGRIKAMKDTLWKKQKSFITLVILLAVSICWAQNDDRSMIGHRTPVQVENYFSKPIQLIDLPTASILRGGDLSGAIRLYENGGALARLSVGISHKMMFGVSFGGINLIGAGNIGWNKMPGVHVAYRAVEENLVLPAIVIGFDSQGYGRYWRSDSYPDSVRSADGSVDPTQYPLNRYTTKARGFYLVGSKGYQSLWKVGLHAGISYNTIERSDKDGDPTIFTGMDIQLSGDLSILFEYDFATNDDKLRTINSGRGQLNAGFRWAFTDFMFLEFDLNNVLSEKAGDADVKRILKICYYSAIP
jgi:hypothetical protein